MQSMVRNLEKQLEAPAKKPAGGVSLFSVPSAGPQRAAVPGGKPQVGWRTYEAPLQSPTEPARVWGPGRGLREGPCVTLQLPSCPSPPLPLQEWHNAHSPVLVVRVPC